MLMEELWGDDLPRGATTTLQTYILTLRRRVTLALGSPDMTKQVLATSFGGYQLSAASCRSDLEEFEILARRGSLALDAGDAFAASTYLNRALAMWRGNALTDVPTGRVLSTEVIGMSRTRAAVTGGFATAAYRCGTRGNIPL